MRLRTFASLGGLLWLGTACGPSNEEARAAALRVQQQHDKAVRDTATVAGLHALVLREYRREEYAQARADLALLGRRYPHAPIREQLAPLGSCLDSLATTQQQREAARQQRARQPQAAPMAWQLATYPDEFGKPSGRVALANATVQRGTCLTAGAASSPLVARLLVDSSAAIHLLLYDRVATVLPPTRRKHHFRHQHRHVATDDTAVTYTSSYAEMQLLHVSEPTSFTVKVRRHDGYIATLPATCLADQLVFTKANSLVLHDCLLQGGEVGFLISQPTNPAVSYRFTIANADRYEAGYHSLIRR